MQTFTEIRDLLDRAGLKPRKQFGQNFLIDQNLMHKLLELAELTDNQTVLEIGPGTGALTEELLDRAGNVIAVEIDRGLAKLLRERLAGRENFLLLNTDILAGKHSLSDEVRRELPDEVYLVSNLPYNIATPLLIVCLLDSWHALGGNPNNGRKHFKRMTFTIQRELADRLTARPGSKDYGPLAIYTALLGRTVQGPPVPAAAFWPRPKITSRIVRIDFDPASAGKIADVEMLKMLLSLMFTHRRKQLGWLLKRKDLPFESEVVAAAFERTGIRTTDRAEQIAPEAFRDLTNLLVKH